MDIGHLFASHCGIVDAIVHPPEVRWQNAAALKEDGTKEFVSGNYTRAALLYERAANLLAASTPLSGEQADLYVKCWANAAMCSMKENDWPAVIHCCDQAISLVPDEAKNNVKVIYRRGVAMMHIGELEGAKADLMLAYRIDDQNKDVQRALKELKPKLAAFRKKERTQFGGIFGKASIYDDKEVTLYHVATANGEELASFPDTVLATIAEFLTKTERALAAVAMTAPASSWEETNWQRQPIEASKVMVSAKPLSEIKLYGDGSNTFLRRWERKKSYNWDFVDLEDIDHALAGKLSDGDVGGILVCIDAVNTLKKLKLRGCLDIVGKGLEPLRGSIVLEQIDLSFSTRSPKLFPVPLISEDAVVPILSSIIDGEGCSLKHIQLPKKWRVAKASSLSQFLTSYNQVLNDASCGHREGYNEPTCGLTCRSIEEEPWIPQEGEWWGVQRSCSECCELKCEDHQDWDAVDVCEVCERVSCPDCYLTAMCDLCHTISCAKCTDIAFCGSCSSATCSACCQVYICEGHDDFVCMECSPMLVCGHEGCMKSNCSECVADDDSTDWGVKECSTCSSFCVEHLALEIPGGDFCDECNERALSFLTSKNKSILRHLHKWERSFGYEERFESDTDSNDVSKLLREQERMKQRWEHLYGGSTAEQRKTLVGISYLFIV